VNAFEIDGRRIGVEHPPYVIAELSANHNNDLDRALAIVDAAADAGADALKLQTYTADSITIDSDRPDFRITKGPWTGYSLHALYEEASTPWEWHEALFRRARERGLHVFSSAFGADAVDFLIELGVPAFKIASFELVDLPLIEHVARTGKPMIMSTGMATPDEIGEAVTAARGAGCEALALLHCISGYPTPVEESNLMTIGDLRKRYGVEIGLSDHTLGVGVAAAAVALGASLIEKHLTLNRADGGPDSGFSLHPDEFATMTQACRDAHAAIGSVSYERKPSEVGNLRFRRSLYAVADIAAGETISVANMRSIRPSNGLPPKHYNELLGRKVTRDVERGEALAWDMVEPK
jgi:pseudaminic acid synthase